MPLQSETAPAVDSSVDQKPDADTMTQTETSFFGRLAARCKKLDTLLCVGLDPHTAELAEPKDAEAAFKFCEKIVNNTKHIAACYKPNAAFFEVFGAEGVTVLERVLALIPDEIPIVLDAKRGDIGSTSAAYASAAYDHLNCGSMTVSPYLGLDAMAPFLRKDRAIFALCKTSNPGSNDFQTLPLSLENMTEDQKKLADGCTKLYHYVARKCTHSNDNVGLVVGATDIEAITWIRKDNAKVWMLSPGVGAQGAQLDPALAAGLCPEGLGILIAVSRGISKAADQKSAADNFVKEIRESRDRVRADGSPASKRAKLA